MNRKIKSRLETIKDKLIELQELIQYEIEELEEQEKDVAIDELNEINDNIDVFIETLQF